MLVNRSAIAGFTASGLFDNLGIQQDITVVKYKYLHEFFVRTCHQPARLPLVCVKPPIIAAVTVATEKIGRRVDQHVTKTNQIAVGQMLSFVKEKRLILPTIKGALDHSLKGKEIPNPLRGSILNTIAASVKIPDPIWESRLQCCFCPRNRLRAWSWP